MRRAGSVALVIAALLLAWAPRVGATAPGQDGRIAFVNDGGSGHFQLFTVRPDGTGLRKLTSLPTGQDAFFPDWSPDGGRIAFTIATKSSAQIWSIKPNGSGLHQITHGSQLISVTPRWSPDGRRILLARSKPGGFCGDPITTFSFCHIWVMNADGSNARQLTHNPRFSDFDPEWSPDGTKIAFDSQRGARFSSLWVMNADGGSAHAISPPNIQVGWPTWAPDGRHIAAFTNNDSPAPSVLVVLRPDGSDFHHLTGPPKGAVDIFPSWSPAGDRIAFARLTGNNGEGDVWTIKPDGTGAKAVTTGLRENGPGMDWGPAA